MINPPLRVVVDTNLFISYLLAPDKSGTITHLVNTGLRGSFTILAPQQLLTELTAAVASKPYLATRIHTSDIAELVTSPPICWRTDGHGPWSYPQLHPRPKG